MTLCSCESWLLLQLCCVSQTVTLRHLQEAPLIPSDSLDRQRWWVKMLKTSLVLHALNQFIGTVLQTDVGKGSLS